MTDEHIIDRYWKETAYAVAETTALMALVIPYPRLINEAVLDAIDGDTSPHKVIACDLALQMTGELVMGLGILPDVTEKELMLFVLRVMTLSLAGVARFDEASNAFDLDDDAMLEDLIQAWNDKVGEA
jgi:hypothetical protein